MPFSLPVVELRKVPEPEREAQLRALARAEVQRPFDLTPGPLLRATLVRLADTEYVLLLSMHHIVFDGWSHTVFWRELSVLYAACSTGKPSPLPRSLYSMPTLPTGSSSGYRVTGSLRTWPTGGSSWPMSRHCNCPQTLPDQPSRLSGVPGTRWYSLRS